MSLPTYIAAGTSAASITTATPTVGTHVAGDLLILACETNATEAATATGWADVPNGIIDQVNASGRGTLLYKFTAGSESSPTTNDPGDHIYCRIFTFRDVHATDPFHQVVTNGGRGNDTSTNASMPGCQTKLDDCMIVNFLFFHNDTAAAQSSAETNTSLASLTERSDEGTALGGGGGFAMITGEKATAGTVLPTTSTVASLAYSSITLALRPAGTVTFAGTVTIDGVAAPNGGTVEVWNTTKGVLETTTTIAGGAGAYTTLVPSATDTYRAVYDDGTSFGANNDAVA